MAVHLVHHNPDAGNDRRDDNVANADLAGNNSTDTSTRCCQTRCRKQTRPAPGATSSGFVELAARAPRPVAVVINPTPVVIRRPAPRLVTNPRPAVRRTPGPMTVAIRRPVAVDAERAGMWPPDPAVVVCVDPVAVGVEIFSTQRRIRRNISRSDLLTLCEILLALLHPLIDRIGQR